jgi:nicotinic acid mononucleotide adenylyltransferase/nicotinamide mononucleotide (NMN) deamidase PncC
MASKSTTDLVRKIHHAPRQFVLAVTGGGSRAISSLLELPGASRTVLEAIVPYSSAALVDWLGAAPEHFCDSRAARAMAMAAYQRALQLSAACGDSVSSHATAGIACTASLASDRPKRGAHRLHLALQTERHTVVQSLELVKGRRSRPEEERVAEAAILNLIAEACGLTARVETALAPEERILERRAEAPPAWQELLAGRIACTGARGEAAPTTDASAIRSRRAVCAGAFNPLHEGHRRMAQLASQQLSLPVEFEISVLNVDKPPLDFLEMEDRAAQFDATETLWFTRAATFIEKSAIFAPATFLVGADTIERIAAARYYSNEAACQRAIEHLADTACRFLVFGRRLADSFLSLSQLPLPPALREICDEVPEAAFRQDISSTELRRQGLKSED